MAVKKDLICFIKNKEENIPNNKAYKWKKFIGSFDWKLGSQYDHGFIFKFALFQCIKSWLKPPKMRLSTNS